MLTFRFVESVFALLSGQGREGHADGTTDQLGCMSTWPMVARFA